MTLPIESLPLPPDPHLEDFYDYSSRTEQARIDLLDRLLGEDVIMMGEDMHDISRQALTNLTEDERDTYYSSVASEQTSNIPLADELLQTTKDNIHDTAAHYVGKLHGFVLAGVESNRIVFSKGVEKQGEKFVKLYVLRPAGVYLEGEGIVMELFDNLHLTEPPDPEELDMSEALAQVGRYAEFLENLAELTMKDIERLLRSAA